MRSGTRKKKTGAPKVMLASEGAMVPPQAAMISNRGPGRELQSGTKRGLARVKQGLINIDMPGTRLLLS
jgi:hypothetical protein